MSTATNGTSAAMSAITTTLHVASLNRTGIRSARPLPLLPGFTTGFSLLLPAVVKDDAGGLAAEPEVVAERAGGEPAQRAGDLAFQEVVRHVERHTSPRCRNAGTAPMSRLSCSLSRSSVGIPAA
jgi:hypothetical protein